MSNKSSINSLDKNINGNLKCSNATLYELIINSDVFKSKSYLNFMKSDLREDQIILASTVHNIKVKKDEVKVIPEVEVIPEIEVIPEVEVFVEVEQLDVNVNV